MHLRRLSPCALGIAAAVGLVSPALLAQSAPRGGKEQQRVPGAPVDTTTPAAPAPELPPATPESEPIRFTFDLHGGLYGRLNTVHDDTIARVGGLVGLDALIGTNKWYQIGLGYDHAFLGTERSDDARLGTFVDTSRSIDELWLLGRVYPWQNDAVALYVQLGLGPAWQQVGQSGTQAVTNPGGQVTLQSLSCNAHGTPGLGVRGSAGVDVALSNLIIFFGEVGVDRFQLSSDSIGDCGAGMGGSTFFATRLGFALATGRQKPPPPPAPPPAPSDRDGDAILDNVDACPDQPGLPNADPTKNGCPPPPDRDHDGVPDDVDACPDLPGPPSDDPKRNGCPDRDGDKIIDPLDACPDRPGRPSDDPKENGCPPDTDGDGIRDDQDACPNEKGLPNEDPTKNGCPLVAVREQEIVITQQVQFDVDKATIKKESDELLDGVAQAMKDHLEILKIEVQGHTDTDGTKQHNKVLSQARAESVKRALVKRGVQDPRLTPKGYGQEVPIADNATEAGKAKNRRVQFVILKKAKVEEKKEQKAGVAPPPAPPPPPAKNP